MMVVSITGETSLAFGSTSFKIKTNHDLIYASRPIYNLLLGLSVNRRSMIFFL